MQVGDYIEDRYRNESGEIVLITSGFIVETNDNEITYFCTSHSDERYAMSGKVVTRNKRACRVISDIGGKVDRSGVEWDKVDLQNE